MTSILSGIGGIWDSVIDAATGVVRGVRQEQATQYAAASGERFRLEPEEVPQVIADLESALLRITDIRRRAEFIAHTVPPGIDEVSTNAALQIGQMAMGPQGSLKAALDAYEAEITKTIAGLRTELQTYLETETINVPPPSTWA